MAIMERDRGCGRGRWEREVGEGGRDRYIIDRQGRYHQNG
jgi:hypothetical protein